MKREAHSSGSRVKTARHHDNALGNKQNDARLALAGRQAFLTENYSVYKIAIIDTPSYEIEKLGY